MPQPAGAPDWNNAGVEPLAGKKTTGWLTDEAPPAASFNWFWTNVSAWITYLKNLAGETFTWTAAHIFSAAATFNGTTIVTTAPAAANHVARKAELDALNYVVAKLFLNVSVGTSFATPYINDGHGPIGIASYQDAGKTLRITLSPAFDWPEYTVLCSGSRASTVTYVKAMTAAYFEIREFYIPAVDDLSIAGAADARLNIVIFRD